MFSAERKAVYIQDDAGKLTDRRDRSSRSPAIRRPISTMSASTTGCAAASTPRSAR